MSDPTTNYRVYCHDSAQNILSSDWIEAANDEDAIAAARAAGFGTKCELWDGRRLVAQLSEEDRKTA